MPDEIWVHLFAPIRPPTPDILALTEIRGVCSAARAYTRPLPAALGLRGVILTRYAARYPPALVANL